MRHRDSRSLGAETSSGTAPASARQSTALAAVMLCAVAFVAVSLSGRPIEDVDLGWHLAGGLDMLSAGIPSRDPLSVPGKEWLNYSWLFDYLLAYVSYSMHGPRVLSAIQPVLILLFIWSLVGVAGSFAWIRRSFKGPEIAAVCLATLLVIPLAAPFFHLRPQLVSAVLFAAALMMRYAGVLHLLPYSLLVVFWANIHVYWVLVPCVYLFAGPEPDTAWSPRRVRERFIRSAALAALGVVSPYGYRNLEPVLRYALHHSVAYRWIDEFQPLTPSAGVVFWWAWFVVVVLALHIRELKANRRELVLCFVLFAASLLQRKYALLLSVATVRPLALVIAYVLERRVRASDVADSRIAMVPLLVWRCMVVTTGLSTVGMATLMVPLPSLSPALRDIGETAAAIVRDAGTRPLREKPYLVFLPLGDGGWAELAFQQGRRPTNAKDPTAPRPDVRALIDGRTLVMGEERIAEYATILGAAQRQVPNSDCAVLTRWQPDYFILPLSAPWEARRASWEKRCGITSVLLSSGQLRAAYRVTLP